MVLSGLTLYSQTVQPRQKICIDQNWKFHPGNANDPVKDFNYRIANIFSKSGKAENTAIDPKFDDSEWKTIDLPHDWALALPFVFSPDFDVQSHGYKPVGGRFPETSIGWYRKHFGVSKADSGQRFSLQFDGIYRDAKIWFNGFYLGTNESGYIGVSYDITDYINFNRDNVVVLRVDASQYEGWFYEGAGIYRHVWLKQFNNIHVAENGVFIYTEVKEKSADIHFETTVENNGFSDAACSVFSFLTDRGGKIVASSSDQSITLDADMKITLKQQATLDNPELWDPDNPYLYRAIVVLKTNGKVTDSIVNRVGIRAIRFDPEYGFFLNGKNMKIKGVCCHQDHAGVGTAMPDNLHYYRIGLLKQMGVNAYRTSHNAPAPELLDACDSLGMLVLDEQRLLNSSPEYLSQFERLILRDRNHPSVFLWSIGNEEGYIQTTGVGKRIAQSLLVKQKELDPTRTSTYGADLPNVFTGINEVIPIRGFNYRQFAVSDYHKSHPDQPVLGTEMGSTVTTRGIYEKDTIRCYVPDQDITAPWWASKAEEWWTLCANQPAWMGGFIWTGFDYRGEPTPFHWPNINSHFGIMDMCGFPKNLYYYYQSWWTSRDVLHISPHWNWKGREGEIIPVWINSNADRVELFLNGKSLGKKEMNRNSHLEWQVPYLPGKLEAVAWKNGKEITSQVETTQEPYQVVIIPDKKSLTTGGQDATVINVHVADRLGREVPDAGNLIQFFIQGDAKIVGVGNGDPSSHEPDICPENQWQRKLFNGKCQLIVLSGRSAGTIEIMAKSTGLIDGTIQLQQLIFSQ
jgi:beta-galactosidase